jgi:putative ABC transport system substrate-binding protein
VAATAQAAQRLGIETLELDIRNVPAVDAAFQTAMEWGAEGVVQLSPGVGSERVVELQARNHLPVMNAGRPRFVTQFGGLMAFGADTKSLYRQNAEYIDKILHGAHPGDLPIDEPRQWVFIVNVKAAQALGITIPPDAAAQVTQWFQE